MTFFEETIRKQQEAGDPHVWPEMTIGHLGGAVMSIHDAEDAKLFRLGYIEWMKNQPNLKGKPEKVVDANIGWCFGEGMPYEDRAIWRALGAKHPFLGDMVVDPAPEETFKVGYEHGKREKRKEEKRRER